jgi:lipopolysaccharide transport system ATP-binding protein
MTTPVITVENLSKYYRLGVIGGGTLREDVNRWWALKRGKPDPYSKIGDDATPQPRGGQVWALQDVNLEVNEGEILGIIGRNGAGKSTLLKILSRITAPTSGRAIIRGRVGSLLEVGTGFHPELTGRENIYLNGAILGMRRAEVARKLEEIVEFAEVAKFVDTPVKRYSSGMLVRLAFAVAAHLDPEILIVDEVLAVGDIGFQNKCLGKIQDVTRNESRTVVFVSHNMVSVEALCDRVALIHGGRIAYDGEVSTAIAKYNASACGAQTVSLEDREDRQGSGLVKLVDCYFTGPNREKLSVLSTGKEVSVRLLYRAEPGVRNVGVALNFYEHTDNVLLNVNCVDSGGELSGIPETGEFVCTIPRFPLRQGRYFGNIHCAVNGSVADWVKRAFIVDVVDGDYFGTGKLVKQGKFVADNYWHVEPGSQNVAVKTASQ